MIRPAWIAVDWGTSNLRISAVRARGEMLADISSDQGMAGLEKDAFEDVLMSHISPWLSSAAMPIIACGMVGSRQGWCEAPYDEVPAVPAARTIKAITRDKRLDVNIIAGLQQISPADVMRGEETQIAGYLAGKPDFSGVFCLPGTHSKWARAEKGKIMQFQTLLTGELFALLGSQSVLRHSLGEWDEASFIEEVSLVAEAPGALSARLFNIRARDLLAGSTSGKARLSGMLIGAELAATRPYWEDSKTVIIGAGELARLYSLALERLGGEAEIERGEDITLAGLTKVYKELYS